MFMDARSYGANWRDIYKLAISFIQPRPIALVSTLSVDAVRNLAPFSFYNMVSANPPVVMFAPSCRRDATAKDSLHNVEALGEFVVAAVTERLAEQMNQCSFEYPPNTDEFVASGLTPVPAKLVRPWLVGESPVNIECTLVEIKRFGKQAGAGSVVFGQILAIHVEDRVLAPDGLVDPRKLKAIGRMGRDTYTRTGNTFDLPRPGG